jgi:ribonuclease Y
MSFFSNLSTLFGSNQKQPGGKKVVKPVVSKPGQPQPPSRPTPPQSPVKPIQPKTPPPVRPMPREQVATVSEVELQSLIREAQAKAREIIVEAKGEALALKAKAEQEARNVARELEDQQRQLNNKLDKIDIRLEQMGKREGDLESQRKELEQQKVNLESQRQNVLKRLEEVSGMTRDQAKSFLIENLEKKLSKEMAQLIRQREEEARTEADTKVQEILVDAMKHGATDYVPEYTVSTVTLPSEEAKGKIIGKSGRNIHTFERYTGVDVDLDTSPTEVRLSSFDPVRREIARISLERLVKDGRIQPTRIEEVVDKVRSEIEKITFEAGKQLCHEVGVYNLPNDLIRMLGKFKYRFSYGQNLIQHTLEETKIGIKIAHELKADVNVVKLGCLLHDIGKVSGEEEGSHVELGVKIAKKYGIPQSVVDCIAQHHEDEPFTSVEAQIVYIADAISGARPGARYENYDEYVQRLQKLEEIATKYPEVKNAYAIQAGREVRVILDPEISKDDDVKVLSTKIRDEVKETMTYPGTVTVTVLRETRAQQVAA